MSGSMVSMHDESPNGFLVWLMGLVGSSIGHGWEAGSEMRKRWTHTKCVLRGLALSCTLRYQQSLGAEDGASRVFPNTIQTCQHAPWYSVCVNNRRKTPVRLSHDIPPIKLRNQGLPTVTAPVLHPEWEWMGGSFNGSMYTRYRRSMQPAASMTHSLTQM